MMKIKIALAALALSTATGAVSAPAAPIKTIVLVHGGFVDGSGWSKVYKLLVKDGYKVIVVQNPTISLEDDVAVTRRAIATADGPVVLVGHSYGGAVITEAGNDPKVQRLVYIAAFAPDDGESVLELVSMPVPGATPPPILPPVDGFLALDKSRMPQAFAGDVPLPEAQFMADSQVPWAAAAAGAGVSSPAWKSKPSWYLVTTTDHMIPPPTQRMMARRAGSHTSEVAGSHAIYVSRPAVVAAVIERAATNAE